jgi:hypothetical protein
MQHIAKKICSYILVYSVTSQKEVVWNCNIRCLDNFVSILNKLRAWRPRNRGFIPDNSLLFRGTRDYFPGQWRRVGGGGVKFDHSVPFSSEVKNARSFNATFPLILFLYSCADLLLLWAENFYTTWRLRGTLKVFCDMRNKKIPAAGQQFSARGSISVTARPRTRAAQRVHCFNAIPQHSFMIHRDNVTFTPTPSGGVNIKNRRSIDLYVFTC